ncbi:penicillin-binding protein 2 [Candidatus Saccharibacteria bacterium]|nr:penicillin-binding protein 2 [Candidatus Saccharibacteria bacterium]
MDKRIRVLRVGLMVVTGVILMRLFFVQIVQKGEWVAKAEAQHTVENTIKARRGEIYMMDGEEPVQVVMNETAYNVIVDPMILDEEEAKKVLFTEGLSGALVEGAEEVFSDRTRRYFILAKGVSRDEAERIREAGLAGVYLREVVRRVYPEGELGARVLGFVNDDGEGQYGVEGALDTELSGKDGLLKTVADVNQVALSIGDENVKIPAEDGKDVVLTIDRNIQDGVERILQEKMTEMGRDQASAVVMDPRNGEILAMANLPGYDPANYAQVEDAAVYINRVTEDPYEPASVCKAFTFAAGIDLGVMNAESTYYNVDTIYIDGWPISNASQNGSAVRTMQYALNWSLNVGSIQALKWIGGNPDAITEEGRKKLYDYYVNKFGLGRETGIELYEAEGLIGDPVEGDGRDSLYANMTFGQNMLLTMLQVTAGYASLINGGEYYTPTVVKGEMKDGELVERGQAEPVRRTVSEETSRQMREMLWGTRSYPRLYGVDKAGYYIGGKTGTAQVIRDGKYVMDETVATYVGFGGAEGEESRYVVMVRIWKDGTMSGGDTYALPIFSAISDFLIDYMEIKPGGV